MRQRSLLFLVSLALSVPGAAQDGRDDGIRAFLRGDYPAALRILEPLAEDAQAPDHSAQFLLALLFDSGKGVWPNSIRACALSVAAVASGGPFSAQATQLARALREEAGRAMEFCGGGNRWRGFAPAPRVLNGESRPVSFAAEGVIAIARGEFDVAAQQLRVLGEGDLSTDHAAQFFMATLYQNGQGVPQDPLRACALYHRAASDRESPFGVEAERFIKALWRAHDNEWLEECQVLGNLGLDHRLQPVTFDLAPGHSVSWDITGATLSYRGRTSKFPFRPAMRGGAYLPIQLTTLRAGVTRRHFLEVFLWQPMNGRWSLEWHLLEVSSDAVRHIVHRGGLLVRDSRPSATELPDLRSLARVRLDDHGAVEWSVEAGAAPRRGIVESEEERGRQREEEATEAAALARIDWSRKLEVSREPALRFGRAQGCGNVSMSALSDDRSEAISIHVDRQGLGIATAPRRIDLAREARVSVTLHVYDQPQRRSAFCSEMLSPRTETIWRASSGTITVALTAADSIAGNPSQYRATIRLDGAEFRDSSGRRVRQTAPIVLDAIVGVTRR